MKSLAGICHSLMERDSSLDGDVTYATHHGLKAVL
jgi:hypothetical protein